MIREEVPYRNIVAAFERGQMLEAEAVNRLSLAAWQEESIDGFVRSLPTSLLPSLRDVVLVRLQHLRDAPRDVEESLTRLHEWFESNPPD